MQSLAWLVAVSGALQLPQSVPALPVPDTIPPAEAQAAIPGPVGPLVPLTLPRLQPVLEAGDSATQRPRAIEYSEGYYTRLSIHRIASYATIPLFIGQYALGQSLYNNPPGSQTTRSVHRAVAFGLGGLFAVNTVTGALNLWESRHVREGRLRRYIHATLMLAADAGFAATAMAAPSPRSATPDKLSHHRTLAIASVSTALASYVMMLVWK